MSGWDKFCLATPNTRLAIDVTSYMSRPSNIFLKANFFIYEGEDNVSKVWLQRE